MSTVDEIERSKSRFGRALRWQMALVLVWMWFAVFVERSDSVVTLMAVFGTAGMTLATGRYVLACPKDRLNLAHQVYALLCTVLGFSVLYVVGMPSMRKITTVEANTSSRVTNRALLGTLMSLVLVCVSVAATTCAVTYSEAVNPLKSKDD